MFLSHIQGSQIGPSSSFVLFVCCSLRSQRKSPSWPHFHQRPIHWRVPPENSTLQDPIFRVTSDWFCLLLRKWGMIPKAVFKHCIFSSKLSPSTTALLASLQFQICLFKVSSTHLFLPAAHLQWQFMIDPFVSQEDRLEERIYFLCCFPRISLRTKEIKHIKLQEASSDKNLYCVSSKPGFQGVPWWRKSVFTPKT